jgi:hypothetical protein
MTTYDGFCEVPSASPKATEIYVMRGVADFFKHPCAASDIINAVKVPAGTVILGGMYKVNRGEGAAVAVDAGYAASSASVMSSVSTSAAGNWTKVDLPKFSADTFKEFASDGYIKVQALAAMQMAQIVFQFYCVQTTEDMIGGGPGV